MEGVVQKRGLTLRAIFDAALTVVPQLPRRDSGPFDGDENSLGLPLAVSAATLRSCAQTLEGHVPQPAQALSLEEFWNVVSLILEQGTTHTCPAQLLVFAVSACIRCNHFARTGLHEITEDMIYAICSKGKSRRQGNRAPYSWAVPHPTFLGSSLFHFSLNVYQKLLNRVFW